VNYFHNQYPKAEELAGRYFKKETLPFLSSKEAKNNFIFRIIFKSLTCFVLFHGEDVKIIASLGS